MEQLELALGRRLVGFGEIDQRRQEDAFVGVVAVPAGAPMQAGGGYLQGFQCQFAHARAAECKFQCMLRHAVAQRALADEAPGAPLWRAAYSAPAELVGT